METTYILVIPPKGDIEHIEFGWNADKAFERMQREASVRPGQVCYLERVRYSEIDGVWMFVDEDAPMMAADLPLNERASWLGKQNCYGVAVVCGSGIKGLSLERATQVAKMLDGAT